MSALTRTDRVLPIRLAGGLTFTGGLWLAGILTSSSLMVFVDLASLLITIGSAAGAVAAVRGPMGLIQMVRVTMSQTPREGVEQATSSWLMFGGFAVLGGVLGTLIGLVHMLQSLTDPAAIGPAMAVALLTQLYGVGTLILSLIAAFSCARRASSASLGGLTVVTTPAATMLALGLAPLSMMAFGVLALMA